MQLQLHNAQFQGRMGRGGVRLLRVDFLKKDAVNQSQGRPAFLERDICRADKQGNQKKCLLSMGSPRAVPVEKHIVH